VNADLTARPLRLVLAFITACLSAVFLYALLRCVQASLFPEPNPATVIWSAHAGYFWRCWTVVYAGAMTGFFTYGAATRYPERVARGLVHGLTVALVAIALQGVLLP
jgi:hypothetical protein